MDITDILLGFLGIALSVLSVILAPYTAKLQGKFSDKQAAQGGEISSLLIRVTTLEEKNEKLEEKNTALELRYERDQQRIKQLEEQSTNQQLTIANLNDTITTLRTASTQKDSHVQQLEKTSKEQDTRINLMQAQLDTVLKQNVDLAEELAQSKDQLRDLQYEKRIVETEAKVLREVLDAVNAVRQLAGGEHKEPSPPTQPLPDPAIIQELTTPPSEETTEAEKPAA